MKSSTIINIFLALVLAFFVFGILLPWMISAADTFVVLTGIFILLCIGLGVALYVNKLIKAKREEDKKEIK